MECREVIKKYEKVDSFLKRCLPASRYSGVRLIEPCVVLSNDYNKEFKFAVLADDSLYITENPPKLAKDVREITNIINVTSVELLNDVPEFLGGDLKYRAHHILITYKKDPELTCQSTAQVSRPSNHERRNSSPTSTPNTSLENDARNFVRASSLEQDVPLEDGKSMRAKQKQNIPLLTYSSFEEAVNQPGMQSLHHSCSSLDHFKPKRNAKSTRLTVSANAADLRAAMEDIPDKESLATLHSGSEPNLLSSQKGGLFSSFNGLKSFKKRMSTTATEKRGFQVSAQDLDKVEESEKSLEIHLYMLLDNTVMLAYLRSTWDNCLLNTALKQNRKGTSLNSLTKSKPNSSQVTALFDQLENEIINSEELKNTFVLVNELLTACQKDVLVKKLFWQSPVLFVFMVQQLKCYNSQTSEDASKMNRADELEFILLLLECLVQMFRQTELVAARMTNLTTDKCCVVHELIEMIVLCPEGKISKVVQPPEISEAAEVLLTGTRTRTKKEPKAKSSHDIELENLSNELIRGQVALLHELFIIAYQAAWFPSVDNKLNICWMVKILESSKTIYRFLQCFVLQVMNLTKVAETGVLSTDNTTLLYRLFSVLKIILQQSTKLRQHIQEYYTEEFRYYVKLHTLSKCLPKDFPLTPSTIKLVEDVTYLVTHKRIGSRHTAR